MEEENVRESPLTKKEKRELKRLHLQEELEKKSSSRNLQKIILIVIGVIVAAFLGYKAYSYFTTPVETVSQSLYAVSESDWVRGNSEAGVTIIEYGDFECPACAIYADLVKEVYEKYKDSVKLTFRHFPLPQHSKAIIGSRAAEAAGKQEKFWEMHDVLFDNQEEWVGASNPKDKVFEYASAMGLDIGKFENDYNSDEVKIKIDSDSSGGYQLRVSATPTFFINGKKMENIRGLEDFDKAIERELGSE